MLNEQRTYKTVSILDDAIDTEAMGGAAGIVEWTKRRTHSRLIFRSGSEPTTFHLRALGASRAHGVIATATSDEEKWLRLFRACVIRVDNVAGHVAWEPESVRDNARNAMMSDAELDAFDLATVYEIGAVAHSLCFFPKRTALSFQLPRLSAQIWDASHELRHADEPETSATSGPSAPTPDAG
jgi:hypothetical protein